MTPLRCLHTLVEALQRDFARHLKSAGGPEDGMGGVVVRGGVVVKPKIGQLYVSLFVVLCCL